MAKGPDTVEMTREEHVALKQELEMLKTVKRDEISEKIRVARGFGDLSENSEYDEAKNDQAHLEARIQRLEEQLKYVCIVDNVNTDCVAVGAKVVLLDMEYNEQAVYRIVSTAGTADGMDTITTTSPVGLAILGKHAGEEVLVHAPTGNIRFKIVSIGK